MKNSFSLNNRRVASLLKRWFRGLTCGLLAWFLTTSYAVAQNLPQFRDQVISKAVKFGYQLVVVDLNADGKKDLLAVDEQATEVAWLENSTWAGDRPRADRAPSALDRSGREREKSAAVGADGWAAIPARRG